MLCAKCKRDNSADASFCEECGSKLELNCPTCKASLSPGARFCKKCGTAIGAPKVDAHVVASSARSQIKVADSADASPLIEGERKTVTALFADIKGSTELEQDLDPEEARAIVDPALKLMIDAVRRYDGYIVQSTGDGIFALFGAPVAHEDHPQRALYAALRMQEELRRYGSKLQAEGRAPIEIRVGVNTGEVVVRSIATGATQVEYTPIGHTTNLASRLQSIARTGSIVASEATHKLCEGYFTLKPLGATKVKGVSEPVNVYEVTGLGPLRTRLQRSASRGYTKFVGRQREMDAMKHAAEQAKAGHGQIVAAMAEAGVGKSRLLFEFKAVSQSGWMVLETFSVSHGKASAYFPVIDLLHSYFEISSKDDARARRERVNGKVLTLDRSLEDTIPYLFALLGIVEGEDPLAQVDAQIRKRRTFDAIKRILLRESLNQPLMVVFEDLHWIDEETEALLNLLADSIGTARVLLLVNYRPEYSHQWGSKTYYTQLRLDPLGGESAGEMLSSLVGDGKEMIPLKRLIIERTEGNPFYMEEMVLVLYEEGALVRNGAVKITRSLSQLEIPPSVQAILAARIDRLPSEEKTLLQTLAVIGREFSTSLVREIIKNSTDELDRMMKDLQLAEFIYEQPAVGEIEYIFKHALTQEVAYNSILIERRKLIHARTGAAIELAFAGYLEDHIEKLVYHYGHSGDARKTAHYWSLAAEQALNRSAYSDAMRCVEAGLEVLKTIPEGDERDELELGLQIARARTLGITSDAAASDPSVLEAYSRARDLCAGVGTRRQNLLVLAGLQLCYRISQQPRTARKFGQEMVSLAERTGDRQLILGARLRLGHVVFFLGDFSKARLLVEEAARDLGPGGEAFTSAYGTDRNYATNLLARILWFLGFPSESARRNEEALRLAHSIPQLNPNALYFAASTAILLRDATLAMRVANELHAVAKEHELPFFIHSAAAFRGAALIGNGQTREGLALIDRYVAAMRRAGYTASTGWEFMVPAVEALGRSGRVAYGLELLEEALASSASTGESMFDAEYQRMKGELLLLLLQPDAAAAETSLRRAIETARGQSAKMPELRATTSLARLLRDTDRRKEARAMLAEIYNWFTEGFDTADLKDAKALLDELNG